MRVGGKPFLVTAAHVADKCLASKSYVSAIDKLALIEGSFFVTDAQEEQRGKDPYDFAFVELTETQCEDMAVSTFIEENMISANQAPRDKRTYTAFGFPVSQQKVSWDKPIINVNAWSFTGFHKGHSALTEKLGALEQDHFFVKRDERIQDFDGNIENALSMYGASGGIFIDLGPIDPEQIHPNSPCTALLAGMNIEYRKNEKVLVAVNIQLIREEIRKHLSKTL